jgi:hypothetical protein
MSQQLAPEHFEPHLQQTFLVRGGHHRLTLSQIDVLKLTAAQAQAMPRQPFTLIFSGPAGDLLPEGLYTLETAGGAVFTLYLIPVQTASRDRQDYQAAFN